MSTRSLYALHREVCESGPDLVAYRHKRSGKWVDVSWRQNLETVERLARGLIALGVSKGDRVGVLSQTRLEWIQSDTAIVSAGAVTVGIYPSNLPADCAYILNHAEIAVAIVENSEQLDKIRAVRDELTGLETIVVMDGPGDPSLRALPWDELLRRGDEVAEQRLREIGESLVEDDLAALVYTSGTTGAPKAAMITHGNMLFTTWSAGECLPTEPSHITLVFLPLAHVFARMIVWLCLRRSITAAFAESIPQVPDNLREIRPHFITSVPRIFEKVHEKILANAEASSALKRRLFDWSIGVGREVSALQQANRAVPVGLGIKRALADRLVLHKIRDALGGRLVFAISGAAPLNRDIAEFFHACGVLILEGIGMTENTSFTHVNRIGANKFGTVGPPGPGIEAKLAEDGEVLLRGKNLMAGYFKDPEATAEAIDADGWLHSGDIGEIDEDGFLTITDRKKDLIVTAGGKNIAPQRLERILRTSKYISQAVAYGDKRKYVTALITLDADNIRQWADANGLDSVSVEALGSHPRVRELIEAEIAERNRSLASFETIKRFRILPRDLSIEDGELTPTLKVKRKVVYGKHATLLEAMYAE